MSERCVCGHERSHHKRKGCSMFVLNPAGSRVGKTGDGFERGDPCGCPTFDYSVPKAEGERLEFGKHRQRPDDAETAPAWPKL